MDLGIRHARAPLLFFREERGGGGPPAAFDSERGRRAARAINPAPRSVDPAFYSGESFARLDREVQQALRVILALVPDRLEDVRKLIALPELGALSGKEQRALLTPPKPDRLDHALFALQHPGWFSLPREKLPLLSLDLDTQRAVLAHLDHFPSLKTGEYLVELAKAPWFIASSREDRARAVKIIAYASSAISGASFDDVGVSQRKIIENTIGSLIGEHPRYSLRFEDLPFEEHNTVAGTIELPSTVILNANAIPADDRPISGFRQEHVALMTLVHEVNHLVNRTPEGPTYASFQDEYRAWFVSFVAFMSRLPTKVEGLARIKELFANPGYGDIQRALDEGGAEAEKIAAFMRSFGDVRTRDEILALELDRNLVVSSPLPDPRLEMNNA